MAGNNNPLTPLRYPGGKAAFAPYIKALLEANDLIGGDYMEPFAGGAGVALDLLFNGYCQNIHINDIDPAVYHFWHSAVFNTHEFIRLILNTEISINEWERQKHILNNGSDFTELEHGFAAFYLNRTNRSGILKGGVIGGKQQNGNYKMDARFKKDKLIKRIERIAEFRDWIYVYNFDAVDLLRRCDFILPKKSLIYLDPPYYIKGQGLYRNFYEHKDHEDIQMILDAVDRPWIVSYDNCTQIKEIYREYKKDEYLLDYCAYSKTKGSEVMIFGPGVVAPEFALSKAC